MTLLFYSVQIQVFLLAANTFKVHPNFLKRFILSYNKYCNQDSGYALPSPNRGSGDTVEATTLQTKQALE
jgi:hypothetical protein